MGPGGDRRGRDRQRGHGHDPLRRRRHPLPAGRLARTSSPGSRRRVRSPSTTSCPRATRSRTTRRGRGRRPPADPRSSPVLVRGRGRHQPGEHEVDRVGADVVGGQPPGHISERHPVEGDHLAVRAGEGPVVVDPVDARADGGTGCFPEVGTQQHRPPIDAGLLGQLAPGGGVPRLPHTEHTTEAHVPPGGQDVLPRRSLVHDQLVAAGHHRHVDRPVAGVRASPAHLGSGDDLHHDVALVDQLDELIAGGHRRLRRRWARRRWRRTRP